MVDVVYTPTSDYSPKLNTEISKTNLLSGLILFGQRKTLFNDISGVTTSEIIYTIPSGQSLFLINMFIHVSSSILTSTQAYIQVGSDVNIGKLIEVDTITEDDIITNQTSLTHPIKINEGEVIYLIKSNATSRAESIIIGYLIDNAFLPTFN
jgi:hypothetical protein